MKIKKELKDYLDNVYDYDYVLTDNKNILYSNIMIKNIKLNNTFVKYLKDYKCINNDTDINVIASDYITMNNLFISNIINGILPDLLALFNKNIFANPNIKNIFSNFNVSFLKYNSQVIIPFTLDEKLYCLIAYSNNLINNNYESFIFINHIYSMIYLIYKNL